MRIHAQELEAHAQRTRTALKELKEKSDDESILRRWPHLKDFPDGCCLEASYLLISGLHNYLRVDPRDLGLVGRGTRRGRSHAWVFVGHYIVDITADQFGEEHPTVIVSSESKFHGEFIGAKPTAMADFHEFQDPDFVDELLQFNRILKVL